MLSFWEKESFIKYDVIISGSGISGLSCAASLIERNDKLKIAIIDQGIIPSGASTKNAGFACIGSLSEKSSDYKRMGEETFLKIIERRLKGLSILRNRLGDENIAYENHGGYELIIDAFGMECVNEIDEMNRFLEPLMGKDVFTIEPNAIEANGFNHKQIKTIVKNRYDGQIHTGKMMQTFLSYVQMKGVKIINGTQVKRFEENENEVLIHVSSEEQRIAFKAKHFVICTNAFTRELLPEIDIQPGRGQVLITKPIEGLKPKGVFYFDDGYYYFRNIGNRILFGGGRNLDFETENTTEFALNSKIQLQLEYYLNEMILPGVDFEIEQRWAGIMAFGNDKTPYVQAISKRVFAGVRLNGMGVALAGCIGDELADMII